jgi:protein SCO1/2
MVLFILLAASGAMAQTPMALLHDVGVDQKLDAQVPPSLVFTDETGARVHLSDLRRGKPILLILVQYGCPSLCTAILNDSLSTLKVIPQRLGTDYDVWVVSFDPKETAELAAAKKKGYVNSYLRVHPQAQDVSGGWHFLTGDSANIAALTEVVGYHYRWDPPTQQYVHPAALILLTPEARVSRYFFGIDYDPTDVRLSLVEASHGSIGTITDKILLFCYHYDPATGRYGLVVTNLLRVASGIMVLALAGGIALLWRADRRRTRRLMEQVGGGGP